MDEIKKLAALLGISKKLVFFGGAGVSTESGLPDFRSKDGLYNQKYDFPPEQILSHEFFFENTLEFYRFYREKMLIPGIRPNKAHITLASLEKKGKMTGVVTQNIDGLHQAAGSKKVFELHGSVKRNHCIECGKFFDDAYIVSTAPGIPRCSCGGLIKPDVVLYNESLDDRVVTGALNAITNADLMIVAGTSLSVYPAASLIDYFGGNAVVLINRDVTPFDGRADLVIREPVGEVMAEAAKEIV